MIDLRRFSFGGPAAVITSMGLIVGLDAAIATSATVAGSLLIIGLADNLCDSLGVHIYQESERMPPRQAFRTTVANFVVRLLLTLTFVALVLMLDMRSAIWASVVWGFMLLAGLSYLLATRRGVAPLTEITKHCLVALAVIGISKAIGSVIATVTGAA